MTAAEGEPVAPDARRTSPAAPHASAGPISAEEARGQDPTECRQGQNNPTESPTCSPVGDGACRPRSLAGVLLGAAGNTMAGDQSSCSDQDPGSGCNSEGAPPTAADEAAEESQAADAQKRDYVRWLPEEEALFYTALKGVAGQKPEKCLKEITQRVGSKDYAQVRHYYYRLIKRLNKILGADAKLDTKNPLQVHRSMLKFYEVFMDKGMQGTCMVGIMKKPRKQKELSSTVQKGVKAVLQSTSYAPAGSAAAGALGPQPAGRSGTRKRTSRGAAGPPEDIASAFNGGDVEMADTDALPPAKQQRRQATQSTRQQHASAAAAGNGLPPPAAGPAEGSSQSETGAHDGSNASEQPASSSHTAGSQPQQLSGRQQHFNATLSFRSSSNAGVASGALQEGTMCQVGTKLKLQLMPLDGATTQAMLGAGYHPFLELTLGLNKSLQSMLCHLAKKWQHAGARTADAGSSLFVHPPADCPITLRGICWGGPDCGNQLKVSDIYTTLNCPSPFQLLYSWSCSPGATAAAASIAHQQTSLHSTQPQQRDADAHELTAELREALSAVTASSRLAAVVPGQSMLPSEAHRVELATQTGRVKATCSEQQSMRLGTEGNHQPAATAMAAGQQQQVTALFGQQQAQGGAAPLQAAGRSESAAVDLATSLQVCPQQPCAEGSMPAAACTPFTSIRKPRGLLSLLQTPAEVAGVQTSTAKKQTRHRRAPSSSSRQNKSKQQLQQQLQPLHVHQQTTGIQGQAGARIVQHGMPVQAPCAQFTWAHVHPQTQQPAQLPVLLQQQQHPMLQPVQQPGHPPHGHVAQPAMQPLHSGPQGQPLRRNQNFGNDSFVQLLENTTGMHGLGLFDSPAEGEKPSNVLLPGSNDFSLKSWPALSPPSNFQLPDGFNCDMSPVRQSAGTAAVPAGKLSCAVKATGQAAAGTTALDAMLGPTDFSLLLAGVGPSEDGTAQVTAPGKREQQEHQPPACQEQVADSMFGGTSVFGSFLGATLQKSQQPSGKGRDGTAAASALPFLPDKELADLTFDFGSLLGVGEGAPSWLGAGTDGQTQQQLPPALGERPFASLFDK